MKSLIAAVTAFVMALCGLTSGMGAGDRDGTVLSFQSNLTTGFEWTAFVLSGDAVEVSAGAYIADQTEEPVCGSGGRTEFTLTAQKPGQSLIVFTYARSWEEDSWMQSIILAVVDEDMTITTMDITDRSVLTGVVTEISGREVTLLTESQGEVIAVFPEEMALPVMDEEISIYTDGTMTMSLPGMVNVLAWETLPGALAREGE